MSLSLLEYCRNCKKICCNFGTPIAYPKEIPLLKKRLKERGIKNHFVRHGGVYIIPEEPCPYLRKGLCSIEDIKPMECRLFPVKLTFKDRSFSLKLDKSCPAAEKLGKDFFKKAREEARAVICRPQ